MSLISLARSPLWLHCFPVRETRAPCFVWRRYGATPSIVASAKRSSSRGGGKPQNKPNQRKPREVIDYESDGDDADDDDPILDDENALEALFLQLEKDWEDEKAGKKVDVEAPTEGDLVAFMKELSGGKPKKKTLKKKQDVTVQAEQPEDMKEVSSGGQKLRKKEQPELEDSEEEDGEQVLEAFMEELSGSDGKRKKKKTTEEKQESEEDSDQAGTDSDDEEEEEEEDEDTRSGLARFIEAAERLESERVVKKIVKLERWQLRKLKAALDVDKKDLKVKALAGDTGLDRRDVLTFLREPPPQLIELIDSISDEEEEDEQEKTSSPDAQVKKEPEKARETLAKDEDIHGEGPKAWYGRKRIPREYLDTFEKVYRKHKRPTGALIQNIVELTHVPKKRVLDWFEARRQEDAIRRDERKLQSIRTKRQ